MGTYAATANGLFTMGYNIYAWFLLISTAGIPVAVAKQVAKYNTMQEEEHSFALIRSFLGFMTVLGLAFALILYLFAPWLADLSGVGKDLIPIMQSLAWAVLIFPSMSVIRGFFQGMNNLKPYAMSQIAEQVIRVIWMLLATFIIMKLGSKDYLSAVTQSTFAAFVGMVASFAVLFYFLYKEGLLQKVFETRDKIDSKSLLVDTIKEAIPFIITGSAIQLFQILDQMTFINSMKWFTNYSIVMFSYFSANPNKITMILISVGVSIGSVGLPLLTENYVKGDLPAASRLVQDSITMLFLFLLPATVGVVMVGEPLYTVFYGKPDSLALGLFVFAVLQSTILGLYMVLSPMLQAMFPTTIGLIIPIVLMYREICQITGARRKIILKRTILVTILTLVMFILVGFLQWIFGLVFHPTGRFWSFIYVALIGTIGGGLYGVMSLYTRLLDKVIGQAKADQLRARLKLS